MNGRFWTVVPLLAVVACVSDRAMGPEPAPVALAPSSTSATADAVAALRRDESYLASLLDRFETRSRAAGSSSGQQMLTDIGDVRHSLQTTRDRIATLERAAQEKAGGRLSPGRAARVYQCLDDGSGCDGGGGGGGGGGDVYPEGTIGEYVDAGTWLKIEFGAGFSAHSQFTIPALLTTTIRGNSSQQWTASSADGPSLNLNLPTTVTTAALPVPGYAQDCTMSAVRLWGQAEHTASYKVNTTVVGVGIEVSYQVKSRESRYPDQTCDHKPISADLVGPDRLGIGESASLGAFFRWASPTPGTCLAINWNSNSAAATLSPSANSASDGRTVTGQHPGTANITAECNGFTATRSIEVADAPQAPCDDLMTDYVESCEENPPQQETKAEDSYRESPNYNSPYDQSPTKTVCWIRIWYERWGTGAWFYRNTEVLYCWQEDVF